ncbi:MAG TPA: tetratricopeptide repeat protein [Bryobacteraceae bacterium]|nr:tetratricopeptide repeat protein [Bryobacteraceae bacterium]
MTRFLRVSVYALSLAMVLSAQTLQQAEALWKQRRYGDANEVFRALVAQYPDNPDYRVRWGRMFLDHGTGDDIQNATDLFNEALGIRKDDADALLGLALIAEEHFEGRAEKMARQALEWNPKLLEAQELLARLALEDNNEAKAAAEARKALELDSGSTQGKAILATIDWLNGKRDSQWDPHDARGYETTGHFFVLNRRYEEGIQYFRKAIEMDPQLFSARSELGINLMRLGQNDEAYKQLETCFNNSFQNDATKNSLTLMDSYKNFVTSRTGLAALKLNKKEAALLRPYFQAEMDRAIATYEKKYKIKLEAPVTVEVYPDHEDFAVRTLGMPGMGALGVTFTSKSFGSSIAMDSPSGRPPGTFHWASTLWHEMSHVFTLTITDSRVPRWFTEGMAVHEETAASPEWGDRMNPEVLMAIKEKQLLPVAELDRGFIHPKTPGQVIVSYYQAGRICDFINDKFGWDTLLAMLHDFAGTDINTAGVIRKELKMEPEEFDKQFLAAVESETKNTVQHFDEWRDHLKQISAASKAKDYDTVIKLGLEARDIFPDYVEAGSVYEFLANAYLAKENKPAAIDELERYVKAGGRDPVPIKLLARQLQETGNKKEAAAVLDRLNYIYPVDDELHKTLGALWLDLGNTAGAIREFQAVIARSPIDPAQAHFDLARAYHLNHQDELAKDESLASLEAAPGFRAAQKLLLELSGENETPAAPLVKKRE